MLLDFHYSGGGEEMEYIAQLNNISKKFPGVVALDDVSFQLKKGEVHILLGENGAGKSTLIKILSGVYLKDKGQIIINGEKCEFKFPSDASRAGVATIYQEFNLIDTMSVAENIFMGRLPSRGKVIELVKKKELFDNAKKVLNELNMNIDPRKKVGEFGVAEKQMVEIAKAISVDSKILIMDEPTAVLTDTERDELLE